MKKTIIMLLFILSSFLFITNVHAEDNDTKSKISLYVFYGENCDYCDNLDLFLDDLSLNEEYNFLYDLYEIEVWNNEDNFNLMNNVGTYFNIEILGVPFIVIGEEYFFGYSEDSNEKIISALMHEYNNENYNDIVKNINDGKIKIVSKNEDNDNGALESDEKNSSKIASKIKYILVVICIVLAIAIFFGLIDKKEDNIKVLREQRRLKRLENKNKKLNEQKTKLIDEIKKANTGVKIQSKNKKKKNTKIKNKNKKK